MLSLGGIGKKVQHFLLTRLDLMQVSGYTIVAEKLNFLRFCAHFRSVHRGQFFLEMKNTAVRKLLPDQWGLLCPVHTPDGGPCGLLSHMALKCQCMAYPADAKDGEMQDLDELSILWGIHLIGYLSSSYRTTNTQRFTLYRMKIRKVTRYAQSQQCKWYPSKEQREIDTIEEM
eukprot:scaffold15204_cov421-Alexandrium_tamarense.AAC.2